MRFRATVLLAGKTATGVEVPADVVSSLGRSKRPKIRATINGFTYRSSVASMGGRFMLGISADVRETAVLSAAARQVCASPRETAEAGGPAGSRKTRRTSPHMLMR